MNTFKFFTPQRIDEAVEILNEKKESVSIIAGGTDLVLEINEGHNNAKSIIDISKIDELKYIKVESGVVRIGAMTTFSDIEKNSYIKENIGLLWEMAYNVGSPQIRNLGTIGGNVVNASVAGDSPTSLMALDASVLLQSAKGKRTLKLSEFNIDGRQGSIIENDELLIEVFFDEPNSNTKSGYAKLGKRDALSIVVVATACIIEKDASGICTKAQISMGAVSPHPVRLPEIEKALISKKVCKEELYKTLDLYSEAVLKISNRPSAAYKRMSIKGMARKMYDQVLRDFG